MIKKLSIAAAVATMAIAATPAMAEDLSGGRYGFEFGMHGDSFPGADGVTLGAFGGYMHEMESGIVVGGTVGATTMFDGNRHAGQFNAGPQVGKKIADNKQLYVSLAYSTMSSDWISGSLSGPRFGIGYEGVSGDTFLRLETRYAAYGHGMGKYHTALAVGAKF
ncbi:hypothetical protein [Croceicoccus gelatinilyticus]|uniref:hypothetical protein n=1 Tax=Croceicoccus gelatinilyticus TaxID=2835536 RepID=UPI001BCF285F|nr:hypothetical protein [Croceicoccus gelatinilyticus]MBS7671625.1 hypothetical protein [Croceicoccus gelatinilyticus]